MSRHIAASDGHGKGPRKVPVAPLKSPLEVGVPNVLKTRNKPSFFPVPHYYPLFPYGGYLC